MLGGVPLQFKEELLSAAEEIHESQQNKKSQFFAKIQNHAIEQVRNGYTMFRVGSLKREEEAFLAEWGEMTNAKIRYIRFNCFTDEKKFFVKHYIVNLKSVISSNYQAEGESLVFQKNC